MDYFCLLYPDAVFSGKAGLFAQQIERAGVKIAEKVARKLSFEEVSIVFHGRRLSKNFNKFCAAISNSTVWLLHLSTDLDLAKTIGEQVHPDLHSEFFIPASPEENTLFLKLLETGNRRKELIPEVVAKLRAEYNLKEDVEASQFTNLALRHGRKLYAYLVAMKVSGFDDTQAFILTQLASDHFISKQMESFFNDEDEDDEDDDDDEDDEDDDEDDEDDDEDDDDEDDGDDGDEKRGKDDENGKLPE